MNFTGKLELAVEKNNSLVCVGLDSDISKLPETVKVYRHPQFVFNKTIIEETHDLVCAYKINTAFYEARGTSGIKELKETCEFIHKSFPEIPIILDAKRADIGSTNEGYVTFAFDWLGVDAVTLHPYLGFEALKPFLDRKNIGCIILCKTSNPGSGEFQDLITDDEPLYQRVAKNIVNKWNANNNCMLVVGATYPEELALVRKSAGDMTFLIPGIGAQGGDIEKTIRAGKNSVGAGMIINSSRGIIFASSGEDFAIRAKGETEKLKSTINSFRT